MKLTLTNLQARVHALVLTQRSGKAHGVAMLLGLAVGAMLLTASPHAMAADGMPWDGILCKVAKSLAGPTAKAVALICVVVTGLMLAFMELGSTFKTLVAVLCGLSVALSAGQWVGWIDGSGSYACTI